MAGIAFRLQKLLEGDSYSDQVRAYLYSTVISSGPFLSVIFMLSVLKYASNSVLGLDESQLLMGLIVYSYAFSMIIVSPFYYVVTRYLADKYYLREINSFTPSYFSTLYVVFFLSSLVFAAYCFAINLKASLAFPFYFFFLSTGGTWVAMVFLSAGRNYLWIVWSFILSVVMTIISAMILGNKFGLVGFSYGLAIGQIVCLILLTQRILKEFGYSSNYDFGFLEYFKKYPYLVLIGLFFYLGIWIDKFIFWFSPFGENLHEGLKVFSVYDTALFLAYISVIPSMAFFLVQMETSFVKYYRAYYESIRNRSNYTVISQAREAMINNVSSQFERYALFQGVITATLILLRPQVISFFNLPQNLISLFGIGLLASFLLMGFSILLNIIFYFDFQKEACLICLVFVLTNGILTWMTLQISDVFWGFGLMGSCLITISTTFYLLNKRLKRLDYWTFMAQPIFIPKFKFESETLKRPTNDFSPSFDESQASS